MSIDIDENGTIYLHQGDTGEVVVKGLNTDKDYTVFFAVKDENRKTIGSELSVNTNYKSTVRFVLTSNFTDMLSVPDDEDYQVYHYGIKICDDDSYEDTLFIANNGYGKTNDIVVFPKKVEGV
jgi:hypothetical protein